METLNFLTQPDVVTTFLLKHMSVLLHYCKSPALFTLTMSLVTQAILLPFQIFFIYYEKKSFKTCLILGVVLMVFFIKVLCSFYNINTQFNFVSTLSFFTQKTILFSLVLLQIGISLYYNQRVMTNVQRFFIGFILLYLYFTMAFKMPFFVALYMFITGIIGWINRCSILYYLRKPLVYVQ